jgi:hypothetical protein
MELLIKDTKKGVRQLGQLVGGHGSRNPLMNV